MLSSRAQQYLHAQRRLPDWNPASEDVIAFCNQQEYVLDEELIRVQVNYGGYQLTIRRNREEPFLLRFISKQIQFDKQQTFLLKFISKHEVAQKRPLDFIEEGDGYLLFFGEHATAPFHFFITNLGELCTLDGEDKPNIICSSVEKFIEQYALRNELAAVFEYKGYYDVTDAEKVEELLQQKFDKIPECSDAYAHWCTNDTLTVVKGTWLGTPTYYLHVYGISEKVCASFIQRLKAEQLIS